MHVRMLLLQELESLLQIEVGSLASFSIARAHLISSRGIAIFGTPKGFLTLLEQLFLGIMPQ